MKEETLRLAGYIFLLAWEHLRSLQRSSWSGWGDECLGFLAGTPDSRDTDTDKQHRDTQTAAGFIDKLGHEPGVRKVPKVVLTHKRCIQ